METDDELPPRRVNTPLGRLDDQRAGFPTHTASSTLPSMHVTSNDVMPEPRPRRPSPKSAGSAVLPSKARSGSWGSPANGTDTNGSRTRTQLKKLDGLGGLSVSTATLEEEGPFADPLRRSSWSGQSGSSSFPPLTPDIDYRRRGSAVSASSGLSYSPHSRYPPPPSSNGNSLKRHSVSSFGGHTIGDISITSSAPLLNRHATRDDQHGSRAPSPTRPSNGRPSSSGNGVASTSRARLDSSSASLYSYSETSSLHSYPPKPRPRTGSSMAGSENGEAGGGGLLSGSWKNWAREIEATGATGQVQRRGSGDSRADPWPTVVTQSYIHQPVARPAAAYQSSLSSYSFPAPSRTPTHRSPPVPVNPLAPLRKRLARSLASTSGTRRLHTEVQLLLELIDALEALLASFSSSATSSGGDRSSGDSNASSGGAGLANGASAGLSASTSSVTDDPLSSSIHSASARSTGSSASAPPPSRATLTDEVRLLIRELVELVPHAQKCLAGGRYGPLSQPGISTRALLATLEHSSRSSPETVSSPEWWPRKLARDCRTLLEEAGLPTATAAGSPAWVLATRLSEDMGGEDDGDGAGGSGEYLSRSSRSGEDAGGGSGSVSDARREELLKQGQQRWEQYRARSQVP
ncbi:hypothetical protein RTBOTA2_000422 [Rhodotorula toruloides]|uniref:Uncharacterized protein n=1 Tax=Rhodotorula toruloides TaxID=5286 RepID=A0A2T0A3E3_RHOTO|nr:hypothetical protein RTBOTA2_000422 [Rhodotorula toruloides]PRQ72515.1 hypothetical protein AAT19DRAFT_16439 [Rhodotorula toruloides]